MKINNIEIKQSTIDAYIQHFDKDKKDIWNWEHKRKELHLAIFKEARFDNPNKDRYSTKGRKFSDALDKYCIPEIEKLDYFVAGLKRIASSDNEIDRFKETVQFRNRIMFEKIQKRKAEQQKVIDASSNKCRICNKKLGKRIPRYNDHLSPCAEGRNIKGPICMHCSEYDPDAFHNEFRKLYL